MEYYLKFTGVVLLSLIAWLAITAVLYLIPPRITLVVGLFGILLFKLGLFLKNKWITSLGGIAMCSGVFAWALNQPLK